MMRVFITTVLLLSFYFPAFAANPTIVVCPENVWTKVADDTPSAVIYRKSTLPGAYLQTYRLSGDPAPTSSDEGAEIFTSDVAVYSIAAPSTGRVDVYVFAVGGNGKVRVDTGVGPAVAAAIAADVSVQDQATPPIILPMVQQLGLDTLSADAVVGSYTVTVSSSAGMAIGNHFRIINAAADRFYFGTILGIAANTITLDTQIDFIYVSGSEVTYSNINMAVDGSVTPVIFELRTGSPSIPSDVDITRMIITCTAASAVDLNKFCDLPKLSRGLAFREVNGTTRNIFNIKDNSELSNMAFDFTVYTASNPSQGIDGFSSRLTFAGQNNIGVVLRVKPDGNLEMLVQDDITGAVTLGVTLEGHVVTP